MARKPKPTRLSAADSKSGKLQRDLLELLGEHERAGMLPTNGRFLFYELVQRGKIPKHYDDLVHQPSQEVTNAIMHLRDVGLVPWNWVLDETRDVDEWQFADSVIKYVEEAITHARIDCWDGEPPPIVICESRATAGVLKRIAARYLAPITATGGQSAAHIVNEIVPLLQGNERTVLYIGDHEERGPGEQIEANTRCYIEEHAGRSFEANTWIKVALTAQQVARSPRLRKLVITKFDHRHKTPHPYQAVECEAVGQSELGRILQRQLERMLPEPLEVVLRREERQRAQLRRSLASFRKKPLKGKHRD